MKGFLSSFILRYMTTAQRLLYAFVIVSVVVLSSFRGLAQNKSSLPGDLNKDSSVSEILTWLDQTSFRNARVVLKDSWDASTYRPPWDDSGPAKHTFIFTQGFRVTNIDGCNLMLRNDHARMVTKSKVEDSTHRLVADVWVQLNRMSPNKDRPTHRYTKDREQMRLLGAWRTEFKYKGWFSRTIVGQVQFSFARQSDFADLSRFQLMNHRRVIVHIAISAGETKLLAKNEPHF